jgi:hypothetical protein
MADFSVKRFQWVRSPKLWERNEAWRARQQELREQSESAFAAASNAFATASINQVTGLGAIFGQLASKRIQQEAIQNQLNKLI